MKTYQIINYATGKTLILSGGTRLEGFKTKEEARESLDKYHQKAVKDGEEIHSWGCYIK